MNNRRLINFVVLSLCLVIASILISNQIFGKSNANHPVLPDKQYFNIEVEPGATLWDIAETYMDSEYYDHSSYIQEVISINNIEGDAIYAGDTLTIPVVKAAMYNGGERLR